MSANEGRPLGEACRRRYCGRGAPDCLRRRARRADPDFHRDRESNPRAIANALARRDSRSRTGTVGSAQPYSHHCTCTNVLAHTYRRIRAHSTAVANANRDRDSLAHAVTVARAHRNSHANSQAIADARTRTGNPGGGIHRRLRVPSRSGG